ncbi:MAG: hypothetical protein FWG31_10525 [Oscillospiraceae bacterium]|nr:hypothetical protein [Oscillospiraceae bacterium]
MKGYKDYYDGLSASAELQSKTLTRLRNGSGRERMWPRVVGTLAAVSMIAVMLFLGYSFWSGNDAPPIADVSHTPEVSVPPVSPEPYEIGSVTVVSGGETYQPLEYVINGYDGQVFRDMIAPSASEVFEEDLTVIPFEGDFDVIIDGEPYQLTYNLYDPRLNWVYSGQKAFMEPPGRGEYLLLVMITWGSADAYTGMNYYFKISQENGPLPTDLISNDDEYRVSADCPVFPGVEMTDTVEELVRMVQGFASTSFEGLLREDGTVRINIYSLLFSRFVPRLLDMRLSDEEAEAYRENYEYGYFIESKIVDDYYNTYFSANAENILPAYREEAVADGKLVPYQALGITESYIPVFLRRMENDEEDGKIVLVFSILNRDLENLYSNGWETHIGQVEGDEYILDAEAGENTNLLVYTFILEEGRFKIFSITNRQ